MSSCVSEDSGDATGSVGSLSRKSGRGNQKDDDDDFGMNDSIDLGGSNDSGDEEEEDDDEEKEDEKEEEGSVEESVGFDDNSSVGSLQQVTEVTDDRSVFTAGCQLTMEALRLACSSEISTDMARKALDLVHENSKARFHAKMRLGESGAAEYLFFLFQRWRYDLPLLLHCCKVISEFMINETENKLLMGLQGLAQEIVFALEEHRHHYSAIPPLCQLLITLCNSRLNGILQSRGSEKQEQQVLQKSPSGKVLPASAEDSLTGNSSSVLCEDQWLLDNRDELARAGICPILTHIVASLTERYSAPPSTKSISSRPSSGTSTPKLPNHVLKHNHRRSNNHYHSNNQQGQWGSGSSSPRVAMATGNNASSSGSAHNSLLIAATTAAAHQRSTAIPDLPTPVVGGVENASTRTAMTLPKINIASPRSVDVSPVQSPSESPRVTASHTPRASRRNTIASTGGSAADSRMVSYSSSSTPRLPPLVAPTSSTSVSPKALNAADSNSNAILNTAIAPVPALVPTPVLVVSDPEKEADQMIISLSQAIATLSYLPRNARLFGKEGLCIYLTQWLRHRKPYNRTNAVLTAIVALCSDTTAGNKTHFAQSGCVGLVLDALHEIMRHPEPFLRESETRRYAENLAWALLALVLDCSLNQMLLKSITYAETVLDHLITMEGAVAVETNQLRSDCNPRDAKWNAAAKKLAAKRTLLGGGVAGSASSRPSDGKQRQLSADATAQSQLQTQTQTQQASTTVGQLMPLGMRQKLQRVREIVFCIL